MQSQTSKSHSVAAVKTAAIVGSPSRATDPDETMTWAEVELLLASMREDNRRVSQILSHFDQLFDAA